MWSTIAHDSHILLHFDLWPAGFEFSASARNATQMTLNSRKVKNTVNMVYYNPESQISIPFALWPTVLGFGAITCDFDTSVLNDRKLIWTLRGQRYSIYVRPEPPKSQISNLFALNSTVFDVRVSLRQVHWRMLILSWTLQGQRYPLHAFTPTHESEMSLRFPLRPIVIQLWAFWDKCIEWPANGLLTYKVKGALYIFYCYSRISNFNLSLYRQPFWTCRPFWKKCTEWPQNDLQHYNGVVLLPPRYKFHSFLFHD